MSRMLRKRGTDQVYIYTEALAMHADMEPYYPNGVQAAAPQPQPPRTGGLAAAMSVATTVSTPPVAATTETEQSDSIDPPNSEPNEPSTAHATSVYEITDKDVLRSMLKDRGIQVAGNPSVKTMQDRLSKALEE